MKCLGINLTQYYLYTKNYKTVLRGIYKEEKEKEREREKRERETMSFHERQRCHINSS